MDESSCSFCEKVYSDDSKVVVLPSTHYICIDCVSDAVECMTTKVAVGSIVPVEDDQTETCCSLCKVDLGNGREGVRGRRDVTICNECLEISREILKEKAAQFA
jgi:hypothetical protein